MDHKDKYAKYKLKYLNLKYGVNLIGGNKENKGIWSVKVNNKIKYSIRKKYTGNELEDIGQKIEVLLPFSNKSYYEEYLVNIETICNEFKKYGIIMETNESFSKYLNSYKGFLDYNDKKYVNQYHYYIFCKT